MKVRSRHAAITAVTELVERYRTRLMEVKSEGDEAIKPVLKEAVQKMCEASLYRQKDSFRELSPHQALRLLLGDGAS